MENKGKLSELETESHCIELKDEESSERVSGYSQDSHGPFTWGSDSFNAVHVRSFRGNSKNRTQLRCWSQNSEIGPHAAEHY